MNDSIKREDAINEIKAWFNIIELNPDILIDNINSVPAVEQKKGEWVEKPHKVYLPRDYEADIKDYRDSQYNEEDHSIVQYWWHCSQCGYEADRWSKPTFNFCPSCGASMEGN